ncbi:uncharacterized protein [Ptychodera flava]|uniref:uncharacterized protein isoform X2 n=1 Tax=Ptychodera flava TaxID=63121 RepID=UPI00396A6CE8
MAALRGKNGRFMTREKFIREETRRIAAEDARKNIVITSTSTDSGSEVETCRTTQESTSNDDRLFLQEHLYCGTEETPSKYYAERLKSDLNMPFEPQLHVEVTTSDDRHDLNTDVFSDDVFAEPEYDDWREGRRIVELDVLAKGLEHCFHCSLPLSLSSCVGDKKFMLGCMLYIQCDNPACAAINYVPLGKRHKDPNTKGVVWDINTKLGAAMLHAGIGERQINKFLTVLNMKAIHHKSLKKSEREVGKAIENVAKESVRRALFEEKEVTCKQSNDTNELITVSVDGGWQKRGSGKCYNSLSGAS